MFASPIAALARSPARAQASLACGVQRDGVVPAALEVRRRSEVREHLSLAVEVAELAVDLERARRVDGVGAGVGLPHGDVERVQRLRERRRGVVALGDRGGLPQQRDGVAGPALPVAHRAQLGEQLGGARRRRRRSLLLERSQRAPQPAHRAADMAPVGRDARVAEHDLRLAQRVVAGQPSRSRERIRRGRRLAGEAARLAQLQPDVRELVRRQRWQRASGFDRTVVELGRVGGREPVAGLVGRHPPVVPRALVLVRAQEVQPEDVRLGARALAELALDELSRARVHRPALRVRQRLVRGLALQRMPEAHELGAGFEREEVAQPGEARPQLGLGQLEHAGEPLQREPRTQHGGAAQQAPLGRRQRVDARDDQRLDGVGKLVEVGPGARGGGELAEKQRVALGSLDERRGDVRRERRLLAGHDERARGIRAQRPELDAGRRPGQLAQAVIADAARDERGPAALAHVAQHRAQQLARGLVEPVRILDEQQRAALGQQRREQAIHEHVELGGARVAGQLGGLRGRGEVHAEGDGDQRQERLGVRQVLANAGPQRRRHLAVVLGGDEPAQRRAEREIRRGRPVRAGLDDDTLHPGLHGVGGDLGDDPRLADARLADELDDASLARASGRERGSQRRELGLASRQRQASSLGARGERARFPDKRRVDERGLALDRKRLRRRSARTGRAHARGRRVSRAPRRRVPCPSRARRDSSCRPWSCTCVAAALRGAARTRARG